MKLNQFTSETHMRKQKDWLTLFYITTVPSAINIVRYRKAYCKFSTHSKTSVIYQSHPIQHISFPCISMWPGHLTVIINMLFLQSFLFSVQMAQNSTPPLSIRLLYLQRIRQICEGRYPSLCSKIAWGKPHQEPHLFSASCKLFKGLMHLKDASYNTPKCKAT